jgi:peptidoglycan/LPS O-acetylase OafA/YrhL
MTVKTKNRNIPVDTLRGVACIMLVAYHVIGNTPQNGLKLQTGVLKDANELLAYIRMPLFTFLSGLVYAWRPFSGDWKTFVKGKIRRLIIPMLVVGTTFALFQAFTPGTNARIQDWRFLHLMPVAHFWFIESLFLIFLCIIPLEHYRVLHTRTGFAIVFICTALLFTGNAGIPWLSIAGAFYLLPFFLAGIYCTRFPLQIKNPQATGVIVITAVLILLFIYGLQYAGPRRSPNALIIGTISCIALHLALLKSRFLASIGNYSYTIYLFHVFFTAASRIALTRTGISNIWVLFTIGSIVGVAGPILIEYFASDNNFFRVYVLGKSPTK